MADITIIQAGSWEDVIFLHQLLSERDLIRSGLVAHCEDLVLWADVIFRMAVAVQAPAHIKRVCFRCQRHFIHATVTGFASHTLGDVDAVVEVDIIWQVVHTIPLERLAGLETFPDRFEHWSVVPDLAVAGHAGFSGGEVGERRFLNRDMAIAAIEA